jgi:hypothetical protein
VLRMNVNRDRDNHIYQESNFDTTICTGECKNERERKRKN